MASHVSANNEADEARASGNELYKAGELLQAEIAYKKAASLAPEDPRPLSNLSAVRFELGDYKTAILFVNKAIALSGDGNGAAASQDKLYSRLAKCHLYCLDYASAENAISRIAGVTLQAELQGWSNSLKSLSSEFPDQNTFRKTVLDQFRRYKPALTDVAEYFAMGHDQMDPQTESFLGVSAQDSDLSFFFAGSGDGTNVFNAILNVTHKGSEARRKVSRMLHITALDMKPTAIARLLIFFDLIFHVGVQISAKRSKSAKVDHDGFVAIAYFFSCQIIPPFAAALIQGSIQGLIENLEAGGDGAEFTLVRDCDREAIVRVLRQWLEPCQGMSKPADVRAFLEEEYWPQKSLAPEEHHLSFAKKYGPGLTKALEEHRSSGKDEAMTQYLDSTWAVNNTMIDYDFARICEEYGERRSFPLLFHPLETAQHMAAFNPSAGPDSTAIEQLGAIFEALSYMILILVAEERLAIELILGEAADIMERMRYNLLERKQPTRKIGPQCHISYPMDYIGGHLTTFLIARPLLKEPGTVRFNNLLNPPEFANHETFQSEYLLLSDMDKISRHFSVTRRPGEITADDLKILPPEMVKMFNPFTYEDYMVWETTPNAIARRGRLLSKPELEKWIYGHLLKICLPYPRSISSGSPVHAPLNLAFLFSFFTRMFETGYPAHWITNILSSVCSGQITTSARPPRQRVTTPSDIDIKQPAVKFSVQPWVAEFTTLLSFWRRLLPFGADAAGGALVGLDKIAQYRISFASLFMKHDIVPHLSLLFWNPKYDLALLTSNYDDMRDGSGAVQIREQGMVCVTAFQYATQAKEASFWLREDVMEKMRKEKWQVCIWRTDTWTALARGVGVANALKCRTWTELF
ncbi:hypothetical protein PWT90_10097 [Aphanocladium album]|nr:hypothetical protein PWT90_10097 [Aphanocladium album]